MKPFFTFSHVPKWAQVMYLTMQVFFFCLTNVQLNKTKNLLQNEDIQENFPYFGNGNLNRNFSYAFDVCRVIYGYSITAALAVYMVVVGVKPIHFSDQIKFWFVFTSIWFNAQCLVIPLLNGYRNDETTSIHAKSNKHRAIL